MARIKRGLNKIKHRRKVMKLVKGFRAARRRNYRVRLIDGLKKSGVTLNRKALADLAVRDQAAFDSLMAVAKAQLEERTSTRVAS